MSPKEAQTPPRETTEELCDKLLAQLEKHRGELILVIRRTKEQHTFRDPGPLRPWDYHWEENISLGVIPSLIPLSDQEGNLTLAPNSLSFRPNCMYRGTEEIRHHANPLDIAKLALYGLRQTTEPLPSRLPGHLQPGARKPLLEILVGDEAVVDYVEKAHFAGYFPLMCKRLRRQLPPLLHSQEFEAAELDLKDKILSDLRRLTAEDRAYQLQLETIKNQKAPRLGDGVHFADLDEVTRKDFEDEKRWQSMPISENQKDLRRQIQHLLQEAIIFNMNLTPWRITINIQPGEDRILDVPALIRGWCQRYEVTI